MIIMVLGFIVVIVIISLYLMILLTGFVIDLPIIGVYLYRLIRHPISAFIVNLGVSNLILGFTGAGMVAGLANLAASVIVGIVWIPIIKIRFEPLVEEQESKRFFSITDSNEPKKKKKWYQI